MDDQRRHDQGMTVRRAVLGDAHVDRATAATTDFTADFQDLITRYAWGEVWSRPGLDRRTRSCVTLAVLATLRHDEELAESPTVPVHGRRAIAAAKHRRRRHRAVPRDRHDAERHRHHRRHQCRTRDNRQVDAHVAESGDEIGRQPREDGDGGPREHDAEHATRHEQHRALRQRLREQMATLGA